MVGTQPARRLTVGVFVLLGAIWAAGPLCGQILPIPRLGPNTVFGQDKDESGSGNVLLWADRALLQRLERANELLARGRYAEAAQYLGSISEGGEDCFLAPAPGEKQFRSLKVEASRLIGQMPQQGRESYELQYGARARKILDEAIAKGDATALAEVSRRYFHTKAGYRATFLLGLDAMDRGSPLAGALALRRLRQVGPEADAFEPTLSLAMASCWHLAGQNDEAHAALQALKRQQSARPVMLGGKEVALFADGQDPVDWLTALLGPPLPGHGTPGENWTMFLGNASRTGSVVASGPLLNIRWHVPQTDDPLLEAELQAAKLMYRDKGTSDAPVLQPLVVGDVVLMRTIRNLMAVDLATGKRLWEAAGEDFLETPLEEGAGDAFSEQSIQKPVGLQQRVWDDATYGTLSSDGRLVFSVEDLGLATGLPQRRSRIGFNGRRQREALEPSSYNKLVAHEIRTGKLKWHLGGPAGRHAMRLADTFFLGPPLVLAGRLYVLGEQKEEIRLLALDADTGDLVWSQQVALVEKGVLKDDYRRLSGLSPSYADGILVCPTSTGAVVGVELATHSLLWGHRYAQRPAGGFSQPGMMRVAMLRGEAPLDRWADAPATIVDGHVLIGPPDSDCFLCLNLVDGQVRWSQKRNDDLYLACVDDGKAVFAGRRQIRAVNLSDGKPAWKGRTIALPEGAVPSGRGIHSGHTYFLPLGSAEVVPVDLAEGRLGPTAKSRAGVVPGNLLAYKNYILSHGVEGLDCFYQLDALRALVDKRLSHDPRDAEAIAMQGEVLIDEGKAGAAIDCLRRSYQLAKQVRTRELLREALLRGLEESFAKHRGDAAEIETLLDDPQQQLAYLRLMADGLRRNGDWPGALDRYGKLLDSDTDRTSGTDRTSLEPVSRILSVRRDAWIATQLATLRRDVPKTGGDLLDRFLAERWKQAQTAGGTEPIERFLDGFAGQPGLQPARDALLKQLLGGKRLLAAELLLWPRSRGADRVDAASATAELAALLHDAKRYRDAAITYRDLVERHGSDTCRNGKTGRQIVAALADNDPVQDALPPPAAWPVGKIEVQRASASTSHSNSYGRFGVRFREDPGPFLEDLELIYDQNRSTLMARNQLGNPVWQASLAQQTRNRNFGFNLGSSCVKACGHLMVLTMDSKIMALDALVEPGSPPRLLWAKDLIDRSTAEMMRGRMGVGVRWGFANPFLLAEFANVVPLGPVTPRMVCFQRQREVVAVDAMKGDPIWIRGDVAGGSTLFGDDEYVFILPPDQQAMPDGAAQSPATTDREAIVLRAADGSLAGRRKVPSSSQVLFNRGRELLVWRDRVVARLDPWDNRQSWTSRKFAADARCIPVGHDAVGVVEADGEPDGRFSILRITDGKTLVDAEIAPVHSLLDAFVLASAQEYCLVLNTIDQRGMRGGIDSQPMPGTHFRPIYQGTVYAFDLSGKPRWPRPVKIEKQQLWLDQPTELPVLVFACQTYNRKTNTGEFASAVLCVDKRTGRVYRETLANATGTFEASADPEKATVDIRLQHGTVRLKLTDRPLPPESQLEEESTGGMSLIEALIDAAGKGLRGAAKKPAGSK